jgi:hypothetical protein
LGEWRQKWAKNETDFDIDIVSFGTLPVFEIGSEMQTFAPDERSSVERLIQALFSNVEARKKHHSFSPKTAARFSGKINFLPGWIKVTRADA